MQGELKAQGYDVAMVSIHDIGASKSVDQQKLIDRCSFPLLQDTEAVKAFDAMKGIKDDIYIYDKDGKLAVYLSIDGPTDIQLSKPAGYLNVKSTLMTVHDAK